MANDGAHVNAPKMSTVFVELCEEEVCAGQCMARERQRAICRSVTPTCCTCMFWHPERDIAVRVHVGDFISTVGEDLQWLDVVYSNTNAVRAVVPRQGLGRFNHVYCKFLFVQI